MDRQNNKQKKGSPWAIIVVLLALAVANIGEFDEDLLMFILPVLIIIAAVAVVIRLRLKVRDGAKTDAGTRGGGRQRGFSSAEEAIHHFDPRSRSFVKPDAPCIVCENTGEDHLERDKHNRIRQLDDWLKTGLIDRNEYRVLKDRYERDL